MPITPLPNAPNRTDGHADFVEKANAHVASLSLFTAEANTLEENVNAKEVSAVSSANIALAAANFKGSWPELNGAAVKPYSSYHDSKFWMLLNDLADVAESEPGFTGDWVELKAPIHPPLLHIQDQKANGVAGGAASAGFNTRVFNTVLTNDITGASLSLNFPTLPPGIYDIVGLCPCYGVRDNKLFLKKTSDDSTILIGHGEYTRQGLDVAEGAGVDARVIGRFTITEETELKLSHWIQTAAATFGLGSTGHSTEANEVYSDVRIWQIQAGV
jgi:hypothetical protein